MVTRNILMPFFMGKVCVSGGETIVVKALTKIFQAGKKFIE
jgi:hypothetical protein